MKKLFSKYHEQWAIEKINVFLSKIKLPANCSILDLGGNDGAYMERFKKYFNPGNKIIIADIDDAALSKARERGYETQYVDCGKDRFPFPDKSFDCIFCNSVIEHVTVPKEEIWNTNNNFKERSLQIQRNFASEIERTAKSYYVQTPHRGFPVEAHTWFPFISYFPRTMQINAIKLLNRFWVKKTSPDWNLLDEKQMQEMFPSAQILVIRKMGFKKEIIAIKPYQNGTEN